MAAAFGVTVLGPPAGAEGFSVNSRADTPDVSPGDGNCADAAGSCSLRAAVMEANALAGQAEITVPAGTFELGLTGKDDLAAAGDLDLSPPDGVALTIKGAGAGQTIIDGGGIDRVFHVVRGTAVVSDLTIRNGAPSSGGGGGAFVASAASLSMSDVEFRGNAASDGAAIRSRGSTGLAGALITGNSGGAALTSTDGGLTVANSTISANSGPGVRGAGGSVSLTHVTVAANGGPGLVIDSGSVSAVNSVIAGNEGPECSPASKLQSRGFNVVEDATCNAGPDDVAGVSPRLRPLADNGGPTRSHLLAPGSPAIDIVPDARCPVSGDQRRARRPHDGDGDGSRVCDAGAVEVGATAPKVTKAGGDDTPPANATTTTTAETPPVTGRPTTVG